MKLLGTFLISLVGARPQVVVQRDEFGINKQIQLDDGRQLNIQREFGQDAQVFNQLPQTGLPGQKQDLINTSGANHSSADFEIIARSLMRRMDTLENQLQVQQQIFQNILTSYIKGTEWFLGNLKPLNTPQLTQPTYGPQPNLVNQQNFFNQMMNDGYNQIRPDQNQYQSQQVQPNNTPQVSQAQVKPSQAQLQAQPLTANPAYVNTKLHDVKSGSPNKGILMVQYNGQWGTVCDDDFGSREANTACRAMGYTGAKRHSSSRRESQYRAPPNAPILLDEVECNENDSSLFDCEAQWNHHNCNHGEDVVVECYLSPGTVLRN